MVILLIYEENVDELYIEEIYAGYFILCGF
jgi:hypothetical protein